MELLSRYKLRRYLIKSITVIILSVYPTWGFATNPSLVYWASSNDMDDAEDVFFEDEFEPVKSEPVSDPLIGYNRFMTNVNDKCYYWLLKPLAQGYSFFMPEQARLAVYRVFDNAAFPQRLINTLLQLKIKRAGIETFRFLLNTTSGVGGLFDAADLGFNLTGFSEDFGQTLGHFGAGPGIPVTLPLLGPNNIRDSLGRVFDYFLSPMSYIDDIYLSTSLEAYDRVNFISLHIGEYESLQKDALDFYILLRNTYQQQREMQIKD